MRPQEEVTRDTVGMRVSSERSAGKRDWEPAIWKKDRTNVSCVEPMFLVSEYE